MFVPRKTIRAAALVLTLGSAGVGLATVPTGAQAAEARKKDVPGSYSELMKMKPMEVMHVMDPGEKGYVTKEEFMKFHEAMFEKMDQNKDEKVSRDEWIRQIHSTP